MGKKKRIGKPLRVVLDSNILVSSLLFGGKASELIPYLRSGNIVPLVSKEIVQEYLRVFSYPKFSLTEGEIRSLLHDQVLHVAEVVRPSKTLPAGSRDPDDDHFLACALAGGADALVSGDADLLTLKRIGACPIVSLDVFLKKIQLRFR